MRPLPAVILRHVGKAKAALPRLHRLVRRREHQRVHARLKDRERGPPCRQRWRELGSHDAGRSRQHIRSRGLSRQHSHGGLHAGPRRRSSRRHVRCAVQCILRAPSRSPLPHLLEQVLEAVDKDAGVALPPRIRLGGDQRQLGQLGAKHAHNGGHHGLALQGGQVAEARSGHGHRARAARGCGPHTEGAWHSRGRCASKAHVQQGPAREAWQAAQGAD